MKQSSTSSWLFNPVHWKIGHKVLVLLAGSVTLAVAIFTTYNYYSLSADLVEQTEASLQSLAKETLHQAANSIQGVVDELQILALSPSITEQVEQANAQHKLEDPAELKAMIARQDQAWQDKDPAVESLVDTIAQNDLSANLNDFIRLQPVHVEVFVTDQQGLNLAMTERTGDYWQADETWWQEAYNQGQGGQYVGPVEFDESAGTWAINLGVPIRSRTSREVVGILRSTVDISQMFATFANVLIDDGADAILIDDQGTILYANHADLLMQPLTDPSLQALVETHNPVVRHDLNNWQGEPAVVTYVPLTGNLAERLGWGLLVSRELRSVNAAVREALGTGLMLALLVIMGLSGMGFWLTRTMTHRIALATAQAQRLAGGDLTTGDSQEQAAALQNQDEIGDLLRAFAQLQIYLQQAAQTAEQIAQGDISSSPEAKGAQDVLGQALKRMTANLRRLVAQVADSADAVGGASNQLAFSASQAGHATNQITATIQQVSQGVQQQTEAATRTATSVRQVTQAVNGVAQGAQEQAQAVNQTSQGMATLSRSVRTIAAGAQEQAQAVAGAQAVTGHLNTAVSQIAQQTQAVAQVIQTHLQTAQAGQHTAQEAVSGIDQLGQATDQLARTIQDLGQRSGQIGAIVETIDDIASQTNLLALNAAIEAARAGEHGKGFAVVADEVRKLAEKSATATQEIRDMIRAVQSGAEQAVAAMSQASSDVRQSVSRTQAAGSAFEAIAGGIGQVAGQVDQTLQAVSAIEQAARQLRQAIDTVNSVTERNQAMTGEMARTADQVTASLEQVSAVVEENTASTEQMAANAVEVNEAIDHIASVSEENSAAVEEVSASTEEMSAQVQEVTASAQALQEMAQSLNEVIGQFKLSAEANSAEALAGIETFKQAHLNWVHRVEEMLAGRGLIKPDSQTECSLGRWYQGRGRLDWGHLPEFQAVSAPHEQLHALLAAILAAHQRGDTATTRRLLAEIKQASQQVVRSLVALEQRIGGATLTSASFSPAREAFQSRPQTVRQPAEPVLVNGNGYHRVNGNGYHRH